MIVVVGRVRTDDDRRGDLIGAAQAVAAASRAEPGCIGYRVYEDTEQDNDFVFVEEWESQEALEEHFATAHVRELMRAIPAAVIAPPDVKFHTIASSLDISDVGAS